jgi:hypothetical protein
LVSTEGGERGKTEKKEKKSLVTEEETFFPWKTVTHFALKTVNSKLLSFVFSLGVSCPQWQVFNFIDKNGNGKLQKEEVIQILEFLGERQSALKDQEASFLLSKTKKTFL